MPPHFQVSTESLSDDDLTRGFSFDVRQVSKQGQFSRPAPRSIVPGVQPAIQAARVIPAEPPQSPPQRCTVPFTGFDFPPNTARNVPDPGDHSAGIGHETSANANGNATLSSHFHPRSDQDRSRSEDAHPSANGLLHRREQSIPAQADNCIEPSQGYEHQNPATSPVAPQSRTSPSANKDNTNTSENIFRNNERHRGRYSEREYSRSRTPQHCGDLEGYGVYDPLSAVRTPSCVQMLHRSQSRARFRDIESSVSRRSHSRASNISRKRELGAADYQPAEADRKRLAMSQAVKHWNECMQITTEESDRARSTIQNLKKKLQRQANELHTAQEALQADCSSLRTLQEQYKALKEKDIRAAQEKEDLQVKFNKMNTDYERLQAQVKEMSAKYNSCEGKIEGAISEQRELFSKSQSFYTNLNKQMKDDQARERSDAEVVDQALQNSKQKRDELKKLVAHIQHDFQNKKSEYDRKIRALEERNESQNDQIDAMEEDKERFYKEMVASRSTKACLDSVDSQLGRFSAQLRALDTSQDTAAIELLNMKTKLNDLPDNHDFAELKERLSASDTTMNNLVGLIQKSILPIIENLSSKQLESQASVDSLAAAVEAGFTKVEDRIQMHAVDFGKTLRAAHESRGEVSKLLNWLLAANGDVSSRVEVANSRLENLSESISSHGTVGTSLATILQAAQGASENSDKLLTAQRTSDEEAQRQHAILTEQINTKTHDQVNTTQELLENVKRQFESFLATIQAKFSEDASQPDRGNRGTSVHDDMVKDIETVRANMQQVESQLSKIDDVPSSLEKIYELSLLIQETSKYMDKGEQWLHRTMEDRRLHSQVQESGSQSPISSSTQVDSGSQGSQGSPKEDMRESQIRKVVVHSPHPQSDSAIPVTTTEEQGRKKGVAKPKSILKRSQTKAEATRTRVVTSHTSEEVVAGIRSALVQSPVSASSSSHPHASLTSLTDYLKGATGTNRRSTAVLGDLVDAEAAFGSIV